MAREIPIQYGRLETDLDANGHSINNLPAGFPSSKQDVIVDLQTIRAGAAAGATAVQPSALSIYVNAAAYDSQAKKILLKNGTTTVAEIDATAFIKDGMVSSVEISGGNLVITFNTDAGKDPVEIPLTDIFDPDNYYDKTAADALLAGKQVKLKSIDAPYGPSFLLSDDGTWKIYTDHVVRSDISNYLETARVEESYSGGLYYYKLPAPPEGWTCALPMPTSYRKLGVNFLLADTNSSYRVVLSCGRSEAIPEGVQAFKPNLGEHKLITSHAVAGGLEGKVDKQLGKGLSTEDYTTAEKEKLAGAESASNKVTSLSAQSTDTQYPSAKCVYDAIAGATPNLDYVMRVNPETGEIYYTTPDANANS